MPGLCRRSVSGSGPAFSREKKKTGSFFAGKNVTGPGEPDIFLKKSGSLQKFTPKENFASQMYIRLSDKYPIIGLLSDNFFSR
ncbi:hypothetical protein [Methanoregula sp. UBA64]|jgi:hypothetical protein|uniref:hypothetical protein n=1 Tax=Methanoregula sp. UBA64 TaxID=1915554 RepID=UPI0025DAE038|nr:hypothetical protein [Methanoregula sp. UBA64]